jgi:hypothetical protein
VMVLMVIMMVVKDRRFPDGLRLNFVLYMLLFCNPGAQN